jgi:hypothetical protein
MSSVGGEALKVCWTWCGRADEPFIAKLERGEKPVYYPGKMPPVKDQLMAWINTHNNPLVSELTQGNFRKLGHQGKLLVVGVVDPSDTDKTELFIEGLRELGRSRRELLDHFVLGYLDGVRWAAFVRQFNIDGNLPRLFVLNAPEQSFYEDPEVDEVDEIETFLTDIVAGKVSH